MLGTLAGHTSSAPTALNNSGQVAGHSIAGANQISFLYSGGPMSGLGTLGGASSYAHGINDAGAVTGYSETAAGQMRAFVFSAGVMTQLGTLWAAPEVLARISITRAPAEWST